MKITITGSRANRLNRGLTADFNSVISIQSYESVQFFLNVSQNSANSVTKIFVITVKRLKPATSSLRDQGVSTVPARH